MSAQQRVTAATDDPHDVLKIVNPTIIRLVSDVSERTGESAETVLEVALLERLERLSASEATATESARQERIYAAVRDLQDGFRKYPEARIDHAELLYGEDGLPK